jgi:Ion channel
VTSFVALAAGLLLILVILWDAFETIVLPRRVQRSLRLTRLYYRLTWAPWSAITRKLPSAGSRDAILSAFGPLSLILLIFVWAAALILGYGLVAWGLRSGFSIAGETPGFGEALYFSGSTFFTLGLGDVLPRTGVTRVATILEAGTGFVFLALVIGYIPVLYQSFSRREVAINQLDSRAGSPPTGVELLRRHGNSGIEALERLLIDWERWAAELLESHLSYPLLGYYRSQHDNQSWLAALTTVLDACALLLSVVDEAPDFTARLTFAIARHAAVDLSQAFRRGPPEAPDRMSPEVLAQLRATLLEAGFRLRSVERSSERLSELRNLYEPYLGALSPYLLMPLPPWIPAEQGEDDWQATAWRAKGGQPQR